LAGTKGPSLAGLRREAQPEGALSLLEPVEHLADDPMVAAPLQVPAGRFRTERSAGSVMTRRSRYCWTCSTVCQAGTLTLDGERRLAELAQPCRPLKLDRSARRPGRAKPAPAPGSAPSTGTWRSCQLDSSAGH